MGDDDTVRIVIHDKPPMQADPILTDSPLFANRDLCIVGMCGGQTSRQLWNNAGRVISQGIAAAEESVRQMIPDSAQLDITALWVIQGQAGLTVDGDVFIGLETPILGGWTNAVGDGLRSARTGTNLGGRSGFGINLTGNYMIDPATRDSLGGIITSSDAAAAARKDFVTKSSWGAVGCFEGACIGGQRTGNRYAIKVGAGTPGLTFGPSYSAVVYHIPLEKLPSFNIPK